MKKILALILAILLVTSLVACGGEATKETEAETEAQIETQGEVAGGWQLSENFYAQISDEDLELFESAMSEYTGVGMTPIVKLGSQVVSGQNLMFLCDATTVTAEPVRSLKVAVVYVDLDGNAKIDKVTDFNIADYIENKDAETKEGLAGGWTVNKDLDEGKMDDDAKTAFDGAIEGLTGVGYTPVQCLGSQVVSGLNYAYLCKGTTVTAEPITSLYVLSVYKDTEGSSKINTICVLDLASFN